MLYDNVFCYLDMTFANIDAKKTNIFTFGTGAGWTERTISTEQLINVKEYDFNHPTT